MKLWGLAKSVLTFQKCHYFSGKMSTSILLLSTHTHVPLSRWWFSSDYLSHPWQDLSRFGDKCHSGLHILTPFYLSVISGHHLTFQLREGMEECDEIRRWSEAHLWLATIYWKRPITLVEHLIAPCLLSLITSGFRHGGISAVCAFRCALIYHLFSP